MTYEVVIQPPARLDIEAAYLYLERASPRAAARWLNGLETAIATLESFPTRCGLAPESDAFPEDIRHLLYGRRGGVYRVLFVIRGNRVHVLHVRHGARNTMPPGEIESS